MISEIDFTNIKKSENFNYVTKLDFFQKNTKLNFKPGLNIIFAPNGTGKSSILKVLAQFTASEQGGVSTITNDWAYQVAESKVDGISVKHDGQPVVCNNPREAIGLIGGMAGFDDDFFEEGMREIQLKESTGLTTINRLAKVLNILKGNIPFPTEIVKKGYAKAEALKLLEPTIELGQKTMILDEPESGLAIHVQANIWNIIQKEAIAKDLQIIIATHSPFSLTCDANFIELQPGYIELSKTYLKEMVFQLELMEKLEKLENTVEEVPEKINSKKKKV